MKNTKMTIVLMDLLTLAIMGYAVSAEAGDIEMMHSQQSTIYNSDGSSQFCTGYCNEYSCNSYCN